MATTAVKVFAQDVPGCRQRTRVFAAAVCLHCVRNKCHALTQAGVNRALVRHQPETVQD
jgi:hypothetical protein